MDGEYDQFWDQHAKGQQEKTHSNKRKKKGPPSEHFKNLFQILVHYDYRERFQYLEALNLWIQAGMASDEEVKDEIRQRCARQTQAQTGLRRRGRPPKVQNAQDGHDRAIRVRNQTQYFFFDDKWYRTKKRTDFFNNAAENEIILELNQF